MKAGEHPFDFMTAPHLTPIGDQKAKNLRELNNGQAECPDASIIQASAWDQRLDRRGSSSRRMWTRWSGPPCLRFSSCLSWEVTEFEGDSGGVPSSVKLYRKHNLNPPGDGLNVLWTRQLHDRLSHSQISGSSWYF